MNPLRVVHRDKNAIKKEEDIAFDKWVDQLIEEAEENDIKRAEKKYGVDLSHMRKKPLGSGG